MKKLFQNIKFLNLLTSIFLLLLPYYLFEGKLFIGGDDTRLFYSYPFLFLKNVAFFSWYNVSTVGINASNEYILPFLSFWSLVDNIVKNKTLISYTAFSLPLIFGLIYFQKLIKELFEIENKFNPEVYLGTLFYIFSPILIFDQLFIFLTPVWIIGLVPAIGYYLLRYIKTSNFINSYIAMVMSIILSFWVLAVPWIAGYYLTFIVGAILIKPFYKIKDYFNIVKKSAPFFFLIIASQSFWLIVYVLPYFARDKNSFAIKFISKTFLDSFSPTVISTATGTILYPLLGLYHRQIAFDFDWKLKTEFINYFDKTLFINLIFILVFSLGIFGYKKYLDKKARKLYLLIFTLFLLSLYFFTVNIGPLKDLFLTFGRIPGFVMFRNFYDKFAPVYIFLYAILMTVSLVIIKKKYKTRSYLINLIFLIVVLLNFTTVKPTVNSPLWSTSDVYKTITIPKEYLDFMGSIKKNISSTNTILSVPYGAAQYGVIKDDNSNSVYVGVSAVKIFSGVNDISGDLSFNLTNEPNVFDKILIDKRYDALNKILYNRNINYVLVTKNIPVQVLHSYIFTKPLVDAQDGEFLRAITGKRILTSSKDNYELYTTKTLNTLLHSDNLYFQKISPVKYLLTINNIKKTQELRFNDSFHPSWKLFLLKKTNSLSCKTFTMSTDNTSKECNEKFSFFDLSDLSTVFKTPIFDSSHSTTDNTYNTWKIDPDFIKKNYSKDYYSVNKDGSININLLFYFVPQVYLFYGIMITVVVVLFATIYLILNLKKKNEK